MLRRPRHEPGSTGGLDREQRLVRYRRQAAKGLKNEAWRTLNEPAGSPDDSLAARRRLVEWLRPGAGDETHSRLRHHSCSLCRA
jgi:hypothetical protein